MPFCTQCGARLEESARFCSACGAKQPEPAGSFTMPAAPRTTGTAGDPTGGRSAYRVDPTICGAGAKAPRKQGGGKNGGKIVFLILAALAVIAALIYVFSSRAGRREENQPEFERNLGLYTAQKAELGGVTVSIDRMWEKGFTIELMEKGKCIVSVNGEKGSAKWSKEPDGSFRLSGSGIECEGTLDGGVLVLENVLDSGIVLSFTKEGVLLPTAPDLPDEQEEPEDQSDNAVLGTYVADRGEIMGVEIPIAEYLEKNISIELLEGGSCIFAYDGRQNRGTWSLSGESIRISSNIEFGGTLKNGVIALENFGELGVTLYFKKTGETPAAGTETDADYSAWAGDYYGFWTIYEAGGKFRDEGVYYHASWDVCASMSVSGSLGELQIWDEEGDDLAKASLRFGPGLTEKGSMTSTGGRFYSNDLSGGAWEIDPGRGMFRDYEGFLVVSGRYRESEEDWFDYFIFLRPWGMEWEDVRTGDLSEMIYDNMMPRHYEDWYLPLIRAGKTMPGSFEGLHAAD